MEALLLPFPFPDNRLTGVPFVCRLNGAFADETPALLTAPMLVALFNVPPAAAVFGYLGLAPVDEKDPCLRATPPPPSLLILTIFLTPRVPLQHFGRTFSEKQIRSWESGGSGRDKL